MDLNLFVSQIPLPPSSQEVSPPQPAPAKAPDQPRGKKQFSSVLQGVRQEHEQPRAARRKESQPDGPATADRRDHAENSRAARDLPKEASPRAAGRRADAAEAEIPDGESEADRTGNRASDGPIATTSNATVQGMAAALLVTGPQPAAVPEPEETAPAGAADAALVETAMVMPPSAPIIAPAAHATVPSSAQPVLFESDAQEEEPSSIGSNQKGPVPAGYPVEQQEPGEWFDARSMQAVSPEVPVQDKADVETDKTPVHTAVKESHAAADDLPEGGPAPAAIPPASPLPPPREPVSAVTGDSLAIPLHQPLEKPLSANESPSDQTIQKVRHDDAEPQPLKTHPWQTFAEQDGPSNEDSAGDHGGPEQGASPASPGIARIDHSGQQATSDPSPFAIAQSLLQGRSTDLSQPPAARPVIQVAVPATAADLPVQGAARAVTFEVAQADLGRVNVRVAMTNDLVHAHFSSDRSEVGQFLIHGQDRLQAALQANGLDMGQFRVDIDRQSAGRSFHHEPSHEQGREDRPHAGRPESDHRSNDRFEARHPRRQGMLNLVA
ncbi:flagellar hook-length control protein FliK [Nitrospira moscoviensis]|uniref:Flagellar hook-length control protein-like C-terminal domain-containing protein n=1 Tax=Nitrospira moscoviensis TaxID=42253 RepID=A0A0K2GDC8_NITMO|nr:flagellar hook-length control protein FliK [Nitrospira moscoviensis]ALA58622.1 hypothetical protein NITMOv2_2206 [Nitrospira moscoviensis]